MNYQIAAGSVIVSHAGAWGIHYVRDGVDDIDYRHSDVDAMVASGDYLKALSSSLEMISFRLASHSPHEAADLQVLCEQIDYVDARYQIKKDTK